MSNVWQKNGKGPKYKSAYLRDLAGDRVIILCTILKNGKPHTVTAESWQMLKKAGWVKG